MKESGTEIERNQPDLKEKLLKLNIASPKVRMNTLTIDNAIFRSLIEKTNETKRDITLSGGSWPFSFKKIFFLFV